jgi:hypothetical protein
LLLQQLDQSSHEDIEHRVQLEDKAKEIKILKIEVDHLIKEIEELNTRDNKIK